jgi:hypothetical protein
MRTIELGNSEMWRPEFALAEQNRLIYKKMEFLKRIESSPKANDGQISKLREEVQLLVESYNALYQMWNNFGPHMVLVQGINDIRERDCQLQGAIAIIHFKEGVPGSSSSRMGHLGPYYLPRP